MTPPTLATILTSLSSAYPHFLRISSNDEVQFIGGRTYRLSSLAYANDAYGLLDDLIGLARRLNITTTVSMWATVTPLYTAFGTDVPPEAKWRSTAKSAAHSVAGMLLDATTHPISPREPTPEELALNSAEQEVAALRLQLEQAERRRDQLVSVLLGEATYG